MVGEKSRKEKEDIAFFHTQGIGGAAQPFRNEMEE